jgi:alpha-1,6-mannosyltransferase
MSLLLDVLLYIVAWAHVLLAPYTKVEESFTLHAIHDLLFYGGDPDALQKVSLQPRHRLARLLIRWATLAQFDHKVFSGAVPRSFVGSIIIAWLSNYVTRLANDLSLVTSKFDLQIVSS